ncbi:hypothetical protein AVEN_149047-1 [Araneus ventricosus]|uniref:Uncharacterized protein n=1 Tax=Araneus ventricosus TaxID=182803 RepID=A0A4Y2WQL8_ARAVE|nr:hypothetical protein AVEN_99898-1 [Araneus ventricosus]GBO39460.1 hypothetical protein AVEN_43662-1 [Araneus ventricosus]GBO39467.1 hypothetical protein AVEN_133447-1 [Araneus ventricosus]GBO39469.1 hypothetical protein AVEN_149047-1 [Araneus ventricosus]
MGYSDPLLHLLLLSAFQTQNPACFDFFLIERDSPTLYTGLISAFMTRWAEWSAWIFKLAGNPNLPPHRYNSHRFFALSIGFSSERPNWLGVEHL